jgi:hypothetical protein
MKCPECKSTTDLMGVFRVCMNDLCEWSFQVKEFSGSNVANNKKIKRKIIERKSSKWSTAI